jgi:hypothetical protein
MIEGLCWIAWLNGVEQQVNREGGLDLWRFVLSSMV